MESTRHIIVKKIKDADEIYDELVDADYDSFVEMLDDLVEAGLVVKTLNIEDSISYIARDGLSWPDVSGFACPIKRQILLSLIDNPKTFFLLRNTQTGKSGIVASEFKDWAAEGRKKVVAFLIVDNDKSLADQTNSGLLNDIGDVCEVFKLASNSKVTMTEIQWHIDAYASPENDGDYKMPVVVALSTPAQMKKVLALMKHIKNKVVTRTSRLRYGIVFDEADKIYPRLRDQFKDLIIDSDIALHRLGFATATDGDLLENEDYIECANAYMYPVPPSDVNYRAIHTEDAVIEHVASQKGESHDAYAEKVIATHSEHFKQPIVLKDGSVGYRKIIVNGGVKTESMVTFAKRRNEDGTNAITLNQHGVTLYRPGLPPVKSSTKGARLNQLLFKLYKEFGLHDKPLYIIGRRKVDRGLGFHFAPRDGSEGLIWTDMIVGRIADKNTAVQKSGRLAGVIAQCPQCPVKLTWWTDEQTANLIVRHNNIVDRAITLRGSTAFQAVTRAAVAIPEVPRVVDEHGPQIPVIVDMTEVDYATIPTGRNKAGKTAAVLAILERQNPIVAAILRGYKCNEITAPHDADGQSYKNHIGVAVRCFEKGDPCSPTLSEEEKKVGKIWNCFIDKHANPKRACFVFVNSPA